MPKTYKDAGVNIDAGNDFVERIKPVVKATYKSDVLSGVGGFAAHVALHTEGMSEPTLVASTDGVGTKLLIAKQMDKFDTIGIDLVAMCVNDICCSGARPLFFLDYFAMGSLKPAEHCEIIKGIAEGCKMAGCSLIGGETAELPGIYKKDDFDLAGFAVGIVDRKEIIDGSNISIGNTVIGVASSGVHSNGYSLVRKILKDAKVELSDELKGTGKTIGEAILEPTLIYTSLVQNLQKEFKLLGIAHITGGGLVENVPRILAKSCAAKLDGSSWERPAIFKLLQQLGDVQETEMQRVFNLGIGLVLVVPATSAPDICDRIHSMGMDGRVIGEIVKRTGNEEQTYIVNL